MSRDNDAAAHCRHLPGVLVTSDHVLGGEAFPQRQQPVQLGQQGEMFPVPVTQASSDRLVERIAVPKPAPEQVLLGVVMLPQCRHELADVSRDDRRTGRVAA